MLPCNNDTSKEETKEKSQTGKSDSQHYENPEEKELVNCHQSSEDSEDANDTTSECDDSDEDYYPASYKPPTSYYNTPAIDEKE